MTRQTAHHTMRHDLLLVAAVLGAALLASCGESSDSGSGVGGAGNGAGSNAALEAARVALEAGDAAPTYRWAHAQFDDAQFEVFKAAARMGGGGGGGNGENGVSSEARAELEKASTTIQWLISAASAPRGGFGIDTSLGMESLLPHLGQLRALTNLLIADANRLSAEGRHTEAARRVIAVARMAQQLSREAVVSIEWLVAIAMTEYALQGIETLLDAGGVAGGAAGVPAGVKRDLLAAITPIDGRNPLRASAILRSEGKVMAYSIREGLLGDEITIEPGTDTNALAQSVERLYNQVAQLLRSPDAGLRIQRLLASPANAGAARFAPEMNMFVSVIERLSDRLTQIKARLK